ncbi:MAG: LysM peptidoglycan-binding domain-containing protein [Nitrospirota bacterium]|nr:LysM peptidoglycan-binding domain-containing protein [Nitrospirota bacterium]
MRSNLIRHAVAITAALALSACASGGAKLAAAPGAPVTDDPPFEMVADAGVMLPEEAPEVLPQDEGLVNLVVEDVWATPADWQGAQDGDVPFEEGALLDKRRAAPVPVSLRFPEVPRLLDGPAVEPEDEDLDAALDEVPVASPGKRKPRIVHLPARSGENGASIDPLYDVPYDMAVEVNEQVQVYLEYFQTRIRPVFSRYLIRAGRYVPIMKEIFREEGIPEDMVYLSMIESGYNPYAFSRARASGPWQFISSTGKRYGLQQDYWEDQRRDVEASTRAAAAYLNELYDRFGDWYLALASYNAGEGAVARAMRRTGGTTFWELHEAYALPRETRDYVPKFIAATIIAKNPEEYGFFVEPHPPMAFDDVTVSAPTSLEAIARAVGVSEDEIKFLNPHLRRNLTPPGTKPYTVHVPVGTVDLFATNFPSIREVEGAEWAKKSRNMGTNNQLVRHRVRRGETLSTIASRYRTRVSSIQRANNMGRRTVIREGAILMIPTGRYYAPESASAQTVHHRVRSGDSLWKIANQYKVQLRDLMAWNGLTTSSVLRPGQRLVIRPRGS